MKRVIAISMLVGALLMGLIWPGNLLAQDDSAPLDQDRVLKVASFSGSAPQYFSPLNVGITNSADSDTQALYTGFYVDLWESIARDLRVEYEWVEAETFSDLLQLVQSGQVDVAAYHLSITAERERLMDFSHTVFEDGYQIYVPSNINPGLNLWRIVQDAHLFRIIGITLIALLLVAHIGWLLERRKPDTSFRKDYIGGIEDAFWWTVVTITTVGYGDKTPVSRSGRMLAVLLMFLSLFLVSLFVGEMTTAITVARLESIIEGPNDLPGHTVGVLSGTVFDDYVSSLGIVPVRYDSAAEMFTALGNNEIEAVVHSKAGGLLLDRRITNDIQPAGVPFRLDDIALGLPSDSPHLEEINLILLSMRESGEYEQIYRRWFGSQ